MRPEREGAAPDARAAPRSAARQRLPAAAAVMLALLPLPLPPPLLPPRLPRSAQAAAASDLRSRCASSHTDRHPPILRHASARSRCTPSPSPLHASVPAGQASKAARWRAAVPASLSTRASDAARSPPALVGKDAAQRGSVYTPTHVCLAASHAPSLTPSASLPCLLPSVYSLALSPLLSARPSLFPRVLARRACSFVCHVARSLYGPRRQYSRHAHLHLLDALHPVSILVYVRGRTQHPHGGSAAPSRLLTAGTVLRFTQRRCQHRPLCGARACVSSPCASQTHLLTHTCHCSLAVHARANDQRSEQLVARQHEPGRA
jgi:hypothetical protein